jgi:omega-6 fatty acid desaturase (delta-12 desaturase)
MTVQRRSKKKASSPRQQNKKLQPLPLPNLETADGGLFAKRQPVKEPPFTLKDLRNAIPAHCFERSFFRSSLYLLMDCVLMAGLVWCSFQIEIVAAAFTDALGVTEVRGVSFLARHLLWTCYWVSAGWVGTGLWVVGHEAGHHAYCSSDLVNDIVGFIVHTALLVPFFAWQITHKRHHSNNANVDRDEVHVPPVWDSSKVTASSRKRADFPDDPHDEYFALFRPSVWKRVKHVYFTLVLGWPVYLLTNAAGNRNVPAGSNHFSPWSKLFRPQQQWKIVLSDAGLLVMLGVLYACAQKYGGWLNVMYWYGMPYLVVNLYLVLYTQLHHTHPALPHYDNASWDWLRGAMATVDRSYGILDVLNHNIGDTHVVHHLFSKMPHYHAKEATKAVIPVMGEYYTRDDTPIASAIWQVATHCRMVTWDSDKEALWFFPTAWYSRKYIE